MKNEYSWARRCEEEHRLWYESIYGESSFEPRPLLSQKHPARICSKYRKLTPQADTIRGHKHICREELHDHNK